MYIERQHWYQTEALVTTLFSAEGLSVGAITSHMLRPHLYSQIGVKHFSVDEPDLKSLYFQENYNYTPVHQN